MRLVVKSYFSCILKLQLISIRTRMSESNFLPEKERCLSRSLEERQKKNTVTLQSISDWNHYFHNNADRLRQDKMDLSRQLSIKEYHFRPELNWKVSVWRGDITNLMIDAIVNAANARLLGGGGVDGAIHRGAGQFLLAECKTLGGCDTGDAKITGAYNLPSKYVIHTVGPVGEKADLLKSCYSKCLQLAVQNKLRSIAFPCVSTGIYGYPQANAAAVALRVVREFLEDNSGMLDRVIFCLFLDEDVKIYESLMQLYFPVE